MSAVLARHLASVALLAPAVVAILVLVNISGIASSRVPPEEISFPASSQGIVYVRVVNWTTSFAFGPP
jgi:hypothetical protein